MASVACPHCGMSVVDDGSLAGRVTRCPACNREFTMPVQSAIVTAPTDAPALPEIHVSRGGGASVTARLRTKEKKGRSQQAAWMAVLIALLATSLVFCLGVLGSVPLVVKS